MNQGEIAKYGLSFGLISLSAMPVLIRVSVLMEQVKGAGLVKYIGRESMVFYMAHVPFAYVLPVFLVMVYDGNPDYVYLPFMLGTLAFCFVLSFLSKRYSLFSLLFSLDSIRDMRHPTGKMA